MNRLVHIITAIFLTLLFATSISAQSQNDISQIERELDRLHQKLQEARHLSQLFSNPKLIEIINSADRQYQLAREAFLAHRYLKAVTHIKIGFAILRNLYLEIQNNPLIRMKCKEKLDQKIQEAEIVVSQSQNPEAQKLLNRARYFRQRAYLLAATHQPEAALKHYFLAIFFAENAIRTASGRVGNIQRDLDRYFEDSYGLLLQAREMVSNNPSTRIRDLLIRAEREFKNARRLYDENRPRQAFQKLQIVNRMLYRVLDIMEKSPRFLAERTLTDIQTLENSLVELRERTRNHTAPDIQRLFRRLTKLTGECRRLYDAGDYPAARQRLTIANRLLLQLYRRVNQSPGQTPRYIEDQLQTAEVMLQTLQGNGSEDEFYQQLLQLLETNLDQARAAYRNGNQSGAVRYLKFFNKLALKVEQMKNARNRQDIVIQRVEEELNRLENMLTNISENSQDQETWKFKYQNAQKLYKLARQALKDKKYALCEQLTRLAIVLLTQ